MTALLRYLTGYALVLAEGNNTGRFFGLCVNSGITVWSVKYLGEDRYSFYVLKKNIWRLRPYLRKTRTRLKIQKKYGLPFLLFHYRRRILFPIALSFVIILFGYVSQFIWKVEIHGNSYLTQEALITYLQDEGAAFGAKKSGIDCNGLELSLREDFEQVIWASVSIEGTDLIVEIQEKTAVPMPGTGSVPEISQQQDGQGGGVPEIPQQSGQGTSQQAASVETVQTQENASEQDGQAGNQQHKNTDASSYNLVADCDAVIHSIVTRKGTPQVKAGDEVHTGDILVAGQQEVLGDDGEVKLVLDGTADADIVGDVVYEYEDAIPVFITERVRGDSRTAGLRFDFFGKSLEIPLSFRSFELSETVQEYHQLHLTDQFYLPVEVEISTEYELTEQEHERSQDEALAAAEKNLAIFLSKMEENGVSIMEKNVMMRKDENIYQVYGTVTGRGKLGILAPDRGKEQQNDEHE